MRDARKKLLLKGILYDTIGMATAAIPVVGPLIDLAWAPYAAKKMNQMYPGREGKIASIILFLEEILPFTDIIPTFTLMWAYTYLWKKSPVPQMIYVKADN